MCSLLWGVDLVDHEKKLSISVKGDKSTSDDTLGTPGTKMRINVKHSTSSKAELMSLGVWDSYFAVHTAYFLS